MRIRKRHIQGFLLALSVIFIGACTGSGTEIHLIAGESSEDAEALGYATAGEDITQGAPSITVQAGEEVSLTLENVHGRYFDVPPAVHDLAIFPATDENRDDPPHGLEVADSTLWEVWFRGSGTGLVAEETETITFVPDEPGTYVYVCTVPGHAARGMVGEFVVEGT